MHSFPDKLGEQWTIELDIGKVMKLATVDARFGLLAPTALLDAKDEKSQLQMRLADIRHAGMFFELLCHLVEKQATERNVTAERFSELVTPSLLKARRAFFDEWRDFFLALQQTGEAWMLEELIAEMEQVEKEVAEKMNDPRMNQVKVKARSRITSELNKSYGEMLDTLDSTLAPSPGGS